MAISDIPGLSALRTSMQWHQQRQRVLAENVSNAQALASGAQPGLTLVRTSAAHIGPQGGVANLGAERKGGYETRPAGNAVSLDDEMMKVAQNQMDYQAATSLYTRSLGLLKTAIGKR